MEKAHLYSDNNIKNSVNINNQQIAFGKDTVFYVKSFWNKKTGKFEQKTITWILLWPSQAKWEVIFKSDKWIQFSVKISTLEKNNIQKIEEHNDFDNLIDINSWDIQKLNTYNYYDKPQEKKTPKKKVSFPLNKNNLIRNLKEVNTSKIKVLNTLSRYKKITAIILVWLLSYKKSWNTTPTFNTIYTQETKQELVDNMFVINDSVTYKPKLKDFIKAELKYYKSPITYDMVYSMAKKYTIDINMLMTFMKNDSHYGTRWLAVKTKNPWNVWNMDGEKIRRYCRSWEEWVEICAAHLAKVSKIYEENFGEKPTASEIANGISKHGIRFWWVYMTAPNWPQAVKIVSEKLQEKWIKWIPHV